MVELECFPFMAFHCNPWLRSYLEEWFPMTLYGPTWHWRPSGELDFALKEVYGAQPLENMHPLCCFAPTSMTRVNLKPLYIHNQPFELASGARGHPLWLQICGQFVGIVWRLAWGCKCRFSWDACNGDEVRGKVRCTWVVFWGCWVHCHRVPSHQGSGTPAHYSTIELASLCKPTCVILLNQQHLLDHLP